jgi:dipeptidyl aminopeptidase/acylaminoacyl peptidase
MATVQSVPYGSWKSPITSDLVVTQSLSLGEIRVDGAHVYWTEMRPAEGGRTVIVRRSADGQRADVTPVGFNVRTRVHEYGGAGWVVDGGTVYFSNWEDQQLYRQDAGQEPRQLTHKAGLRYADGTIDGRRGRMICVCEEHTVAGREATNSLVAVGLDGGEVKTLAEGNDFYASPRISPDGSRLAWLAWNHPNMPWDGTELWVGEVLSGGSLRQVVRVAGGEAESIFQPEWSPDGTLHFVSDRSGWWNLYCWRAGETEPLIEEDAEFGLPQWVFGMSTYAFDPGGDLICAYSSQGTWHLARLDTTTGGLTALDCPYSELTQIRAAAGRVYFRGGSASESMAVVELDIATGSLEVLRRSSELPVEEGYLSAAQAVAFPTEGGSTAYGLFYPPRNRDMVAPLGELPPLLVLSHGGPTGSASSTLNLGIQYWTSRGLAVLDVNYGGSTGYGRAYRQRYYGVSDLEALAKETHKFESRYLDRLIGAYPEHRDLYVARSPIHAVDRLACPVIFFQGLEDEVVPPNQAERMVDALREKGLPVAYVPFAGEQHGFRRAENIKRALDAELYFYAKVFGFDLAEPVEPVAIDNL